MLYADAGAVFAAGCSCFHGCGNVVHNQVLHISAAQHTPSDPEAYAQATWVRAEGVAEGGEDVLRTRVPGNRGNTPFPQSLNP